MTIRTFWTIFIKILGISLVLNSLTVIPQFLSTLFAYNYPYATIQSFIVSFGILLLTIGIFIFILYLFVFKTAWLIDKLHLEKGFDEEKIDLNIQLSTILNVSIILIGGLMIVDALPVFCKEIFVYYQRKSLFDQNPTSGWIIFYLVKGLLGYLLMTNSKSLVVLIQKNASKEEDDQAE